MRHSPWVLLINTGPGFEARLQAQPLGTVLWHQRYAVHAVMRHLTHTYESLQRCPTCLQTAISKSSACNQYLILSPFLLPITCILALKQRFIIQTLLILNLLNCVLSV